MSATPMETEEAGAGPQSNANAPTDHHRIESLLQSMGVDYEPRIVNLLLDYTYKYVTEILVDAEAYGEHAGKLEGTVEMDDTMLAIQARTILNFAQPPPIDDLTRLASKHNEKDIPKFSWKAGLMIPDANQEGNVTAQSFQFIPPSASAAAAAVERGR